jgi:hypothetical protein
MKSFSTCLVLLLFVAAPSPGVSAQERTPEWEEAVERAGAMGEHHQLLERYVGTWTWRMREWSDPAADPIEFGGALEIHPAMGGRFVEGTFTGGGGFEARWVIGFNNVSTQYESVFYYTGNTAIETTTGAVDPDDGTLLMSGTTLDPLARAPRERRIVTTFVSTDEIREVGYARRGGREVKTYEMTYRRDQ